MNRIFLDVQKYATLDATREMRHLLEKVAQSIVPCLSIRRRMLLCLSEMATNLVKHPASEASRMGMRFGCNNREWWLEIIDNGNSWDPTKHVDLEKLGEFSEAENGRGIALLHLQCDRIEYHPSNGSGRNRLRLSWEIPDQKQRPGVLIVEDDETLRRLYALYLEEAFEVTTAASGREALLKLDKGQIELVLSDICMPQMDGIELREQLAENTDSQLISFVFLTAKSDAVHVKRAANLGIDDYLVKPIDKARLIGTIQRVLTRSRQTHQQLTDRLDKKITSALAPEIPAKACDWRLEAMSRHTGSGGGDLLLHQSGNNRFQLVLADIMGHDDSAKFFAHAYGGYLRSMMQAIGTDGDPTQLLEQLSNFALQDKLASNVILTCCSATLSSGGSISLASAGHPPPLHISKAGARTVSVEGILPGLLPATTYQSVSLQLTAGERIAMYTDGLFESATDNSARKNLEDRIIETLTGTLNLPIKESLAQIMDIFDRLAGTPPGDDALLLLMEPVK
jgi:sigma-B regulation protein RsbU (phosphoserine phosphatase)